MKKLQKLDLKLREKGQTYTPVGNMSGGYPRLVDCMNYTKYKLTEKEVKTVIDSLKDNNQIMMTVTQGGSGFYPIFNVLKGNFLFVGNDNPHMETLVSFEEKQLPDGYDFDKLSDVFNSEDNLEKLEYFKQEKPRKNESYRY